MPPLRTIIAGGGSDAWPASPQNQECRDRPTAQRLRTSRRPHVPRRRPWARNLTYTSVRWPSRMIGSTGRRWRAAGWKCCPSPAADPPDLTRNRTRSREHPRGSAQASNTRPGRRSNPLVGLLGMLPRRTMLLSAPPSALATPDVPRRSGPEVAGARMWWPRGRRNTSGRRRGPRDRGRRCPQSDGCGDQQPVPRRALGFFMSPLLGRGLDGSPDRRTLVVLVLTREPLMHSGAIGKPPTPTRLGNRTCGANPQ